jgi:hypothetical protein
MSWNQTQQVNVALYRWAIDSLVSQLTEGFPLLRLINDAATRRFFSALETLVEDQRQPFLRALVKRFHPDAATLLGETVTPDEQRLIQIYLDIPPPYKEPALGWKKAPLVARLREVIPNVYGVNADVDWVGSEALIRTQFGPFQVETSLEVDTPIWKLRYEHKLEWNDNDKGVAWVQTNPLRWWGISSETDWGWAETPDEIANGFAALSRHFLAALPFFFSAR